MAAVSPVRHYDRTSGMPATRVCCLAEDSTGLLWMGTDEGLLGFDGVGFEHYTVWNSGLSGNLFSTMWLEPGGARLWLGLLSGLAVMDVSRRVIRPFEIQSIYNVASLSPAADGGLWVLNIEDRFAHIDVTTDSVTTYELSDFSLPRRPKRLIDRGGGRLWLDFAEGSFGRWDVDLSRSAARRVDSWEPSPRERDELTGEGVWLTDHAGNVWHGSNLGLDCTPHLSSEFAYWEAVSGRQVTCLATTSDASVWLGSNHALIRVDSAGVVNHYVLPGSTPHALAVDGASLLVATGDAGLWRWSPDGGVSQLSASHPSMSVYTLLRHDGGWLCGTSEGLYELPDGASDLRPVEAVNRVLPSPYVVALAADAHARLWVGTYGSGLLVFDRQWKLVGRQHPRDTGFPSGAIVDLLCDRRGAVWAATREGVMLFEAGDPATYRAFSPTEGLPSLYTCGIVEDGDGRIWCTTAQGIARWEASAGQFCAYLCLWGGSESVFYDRSLAVLPDGRIAAGGEQGAVVFNPRRAAEPLALPRLRLMSFMLLGTGADGLQMAQVVPVDSLSFSHRDNSFRLTFGLADAAFEGAVEYAYRLQGASSGWVSLGTTPRLELFSLQPRHYVVELRARPTGHPWSRAVTCSVAFRVCPPWWAAWWAYVLYALFGIALLVWWLRAYRRHLELESNLRYAESMIRKLREERAKVEEKTAEAGDSGVAPKSEASENTAEVCAPRDEWLERLSQCIYENLDNPSLDIDLLTERLGTSRSTLYRKLKSLLGMSANEYIRWVRLHEAANRIRSGYLERQTVTALAYDCGFSSVSYFRACFKEEYGVLPSEWNENDRK